MSEAITSPPGAPNYPILARESPGQGVRDSGLLATDVGLPLANSAGTLDQHFRVGFPIAASWSEYDEMLELFDAGIGPEPQGPWADLSDEGSNKEPSSRTLRRRRHMRKSEVQALLARDGRRSVDSASARVAARRNARDDRWMVMCEWCGAVFEAVRSDARYCPKSMCQKKAKKAARR